ncbi:MAG: phosphonopyruvate decarboxylase [Rhodospirillaceae bacterium]|nr:phosphonopyruvate decarboxylase [Rhodospirillaceae bacterium]MBT6139257.1 phosphonopyruvate decarboxylase [Rhodospirillaceae bacterium]
MDQDWTDDAFALFHEHGVKQVAYVPDAGLKSLLIACQADNAIKAVTLTTEEEGIALSAGAWLGGERSVVMMQSSGVGNTLNMIGSLSMTCKFPLVMIVTMRGQHGESNPWQMPMGAATPGILREMGMRVFEVETREEARDAMDSAMRMAFHADEQVAVLISQRLIGAKAFIADVAKEVTQHG